MKVKDILKEFSEGYNPEDEVIIFWWDSATFEQTAGTWEKVVKVADNCGISLYDVKEQISELIAEQESAINAELAIDTYLSRKSEEELV